MAIAPTVFNKLQVGMESTKGTLVPATRVLLVEPSTVFSEEQEKYAPNYMRGVRTLNHTAGIVMRKGTVVDISTDLTAEEALWPLLTGIRGAVTGTGAGADKTWTFTPQMTVDPTLDSATLEFIRGDGTTNHYYAESGYGMTESFRWEWTYNQPAKASWRMFARARQTGTPTGSLVPYASREVLTANQLAIFKDTTWAGLGGTQLTGIMRSCVFECTTGLEGDYTLDARTDLDFTKHLGGNLSATMQLVFEFDATGAAILTNWRANDIVFIRLRSRGSALGAGFKTVQADMACRFTNAPAAFSDDGGRVIATLNLESVYDETSTNMLLFTVVNALTAVA